MQLFTNIEFKPTEFDQVDRVLSKLINDGWILIDEKTFSLTKKDSKKEVVAKKYFFEINL